MLVVMDGPDKKLGCVLKVWREPNEMVFVFVEYNHVLIARLLRYVYELDVYLNLVEDFILAIS
jgi:hypothetical protein